MCDDIYRVLNSEKFKKLEPEVALMYLVLRASVVSGENVVAKLYIKEGKYITGVNVQVLAQRLHRTEIEVRRYIEDLRKHRLVKKHNHGLYLGSREEGWLMDIPPKEPRKNKPALERLREKLRQDRESLDKIHKIDETILDNFKKEILGDIITSSVEDRAKVMEEYCSIYEKVFGIHPPDPYGRDERSVLAQKKEYARRLLSIFSNDCDKAVQAIAFAADNWNKIRRARLTAHSYMFWNVIGSATFWKRVRLAKDTGFKAAGDNRPKFIVDYFENRHKDMWGYPPKDLGDYSNPMAARPVKLKMVKAGIENTGSGDKLLDIIDFIFDNWEKLKSAYKWETTSPGWKMLASKPFMEFMDKVRNEGIKETRSSWSGEVKR